MQNEKDIKYEGVGGVPVIRDLSKVGKKHTGLWRMNMPVYDKSKCIFCKRCFTFCPDSAISWNKQPVIDYYVCKGCGICAVECPTSAMSMKKEE